MTIAGHAVKAGDYLTINGTTGDVMLGEVPTVAPKISGDFATLMIWADGVRRLKVHANAETAVDARTARPVEGSVVDADEDLAALCSRMQESDNRHCAILFCEELDEPITSSRRASPAVPRGAVH